MVRLQTAGSCRSRSRSRCRAGACRVRLQPAACQAGLVRPHRVQRLGSAASTPWMNRRAALARRRCLGAYRAPTGSGDEVRRHRHPSTTARAVIRRGRCAAGSASCARPTRSFSPPPAVACCRSPRSTACRCGSFRGRSRSGCRMPTGPCTTSRRTATRWTTRLDQSSGKALVHLISSRHTVERTACTPGVRISVSIRKSDRLLRSRATTFST